MTGAGHERPHGWLLSVWVGVAVVAHTLVALFGVLSRWLQVGGAEGDASRSCILGLLLFDLGWRGNSSGPRLSKEHLKGCGYNLLRPNRMWRGRGLPLTAAVANALCAQVEPTPPLPALRLALLVSLLALASLMLLHGSIVLVRLVRQRWRQHNSPLGWGGATPSPDKPAGEPTKLCPIGIDSSSSIHLTPGHSSRAAGDAAAGVAVPFPNPSQAATEAAAASIPAHRPSSPFLQRGDSTFVRQPGQPPPLRPEMPVRHGLTRRVLNMGAKHPWLVYHGALAITTVTFSIALLSQLVAPGYVDAALGELQPSLSLRFLWQRCFCFLFAA